MTQTRLDAAVTRPGEEFSRVALMPESVDLLRKLWTQHGPLMFHQSGGCCDGSSPMCYPAGEFNISDTDVHLGELDGVPFYMGCEQFAYWEHTQLIIDVVAGNGGMFSLDNGTGKRFLTRSRLFSDEELEKLTQKEETGETPTENPNGEPQRRTPTETRRAD